MAKNLGLGNENEDLKELFRHHIESFDHMVEAGLETMFHAIKPVKIYDSFTNKTLRNILAFSLSYNTVLPYKLYSSIYLIFGLLTHGG